MFVKFPSVWYLTLKFSFINQEDYLIVRLLTYLFIYCIYVFIYLFIYFILFYLFI